MKKTVLSFVSIITLGFTSYAQNVTITDPNFKAALLANTNINTVNDGEISFAEAISYNGSINVSDKGISSLIGIEAFENITELWCQRNPLKTINVSKNKFLTKLDCIETQLKALDISQNTLLIMVYANGNDIYNLDVTKNTKLTDLYLDGNNLSSLNLTQNPLLENLYAASNPTLFCIKALNSQIKSNWLINEYSSISEDCNITNVNIPDPNFKAALLANPNINTVNDGEISFAEAISYNGEISVDEIGSAIGIEKFINITSLYLSNSDMLDYLNLSQNTKLKSIELHNLDALASLDLDDNTELESVTLDFKVSNIDFSKNLALKSINIPNINLSSIDLSKNIALESLDIYLDPKNINTINLNNNINLKNLNISSQISGPDFIVTEPYFSLNLNNNINLDRLFISCPIAYLDLSANVNLTVLGVNSGNILEFLDLSNNVQLGNLYLNNNRLSSLNISMLKNLEYLDCSNNTNLAKVCVADSAFAAQQELTFDEDNEVFFVKGAECEWTEECINAIIPDVAFINSLLNNPLINTNNDNKISLLEAAEYNGALDVSNKGINNLSGIEYFSHISSLNCSDNNLSTLDLSDNFHLTNINASNNNLNSITFPRGFIQNARLSGKIVTANQILLHLNLSGNAFTVIDLSNLIALQTLILDDNNFESINLSKNVNLSDFSAVNNSNLYTVYVNDKQNTTIWQVPSTTLFILDGVTAINNVQVVTPKTIMAIYNLQGQKVDTNFNGFVIIKYTDGSTLKTIQQ